MSRTLNSSASSSQPVKHKGGHIEDMHLAIDMVYFLTSDRRSFLGDRRIERAIQIATERNCCEGRRHIQAY